MKIVQVLIGLVITSMHQGIAAPFVVPTVFFSISIAKHEQLSWMQNTMASVINTVATEEALEALSKLGVKKTMSIIGFERKPSFGISVVYLTDKIGELLPVGTAVEQKLKERKQEVFSVELSHDGALFGNDLVVKIINPYEKLVALRTAICTCVDAAAINKTFPFVPHVTLGKVRLKEVEAFVARVGNVSHDNPALITMSNRIRQRSDEVAEMMPHHNKFPVTIALRGLDLYDFNHTCVKKIVFKD